MWVCYTSHNVSWTIYKNAQVVSSFETTVEVELVEPCPVVLQQPFGGKNEEKFTAHSTPAVYPFFLFVYV